jgi:hypothetical protein
MSTANLPAVTSASEIVYARWNSVFDPPGSGNQNRSHAARFGLHFFEQCRRHHAHTHEMWRNPNSFDHGCHVVAGAETP